MEERLIPYTINETGEVIISARNLHKFLQIKTKFSIWITRMIEGGFKENEDYNIFISLEKQLNSSEFILQKSDKEEVLDKQTPLESTINNCSCENVNDLFTNFRDTAKMFGMKERPLIDWLISNDFCYRDNSKRIRPRAKYMRYFELKPFRSPTGYVGVHTLINDNGRDFFANLLAEEDIIQVEYTNIL